MSSSIFFFNGTATTEIYTLSHTTLFRSWIAQGNQVVRRVNADTGAIEKTFVEFGAKEVIARDRKSTRLNSSHSSISYAVFCLKKKKNKSVPLCLKIHPCFEHDDLCIVLT